MKGKCGKGEEPVILIVDSWIMKDFMDFIIYKFGAIMDLFIASVPLILLYVYRRILKIGYKEIASCLLLNLAVSIFFWIKLENVGLALYHGAMYLITYVNIWIGYTFEKRKNESD